MNAKRRAREHDLLRAALEVIVLREGLCADCPSTFYRLRWDDAADRWKVDTGHPATCPVRRSPRWFERMFADRLRALLILHDIPLSDYLDDPVGQHTGTHR